VISHIRCTESIFNRDIKSNCIPYIGIYRRDMIYIEESGKIREKNTINFKMKKAIFGIIQEIQTFQNVQYELKLDPVLNARLRTLPGLPNGIGYEEYKVRVLYNLSLQREPKNATKNDIQ